MKLLIACACGLAIMSGVTKADSCWILTGMVGKTAFASDSYRITDDGFSKSVFVVHFRDASPDIETVGGNSSYGPGNFVKVNDFMIIYADPENAATVETWAVDADKGVGYMTQMRAGFGGFNKAAMFMGKAMPGC